MGLVFFCYLVITGAEMGHIWNGWAGLSLSTAPRGGGRGKVGRLYRKINRSANPAVQYQRWVDAMLAPTNHERVTFLRWYEDDLDRKIEQCLKDL